MEQTHVGSMHGMLAPKPKTRDPKNLDALRDTPLRFLAFSSAR